MALIDAIAAGERIAAPIALVVAHPDDETVGLGSRLRSFAALRLIHLTDGAPRDLADARRAGFADRASYAAARAAELDAALRALDTRPVLRRHYGLPDQEIVFHLGALVERLTADLTGSAAVITHSYEHGHPDHDSAALAVALACARLGEAAPARLEFASYHLAWGQEVFGAFWTVPEAPERRIPLTPAEQAKKQAAIACHATQAAILARFPLATERLRPAPAYDFTQPAPPGAALYDRFGWKMTAATWRQEAARALQSFSC